ncbi:MAG: ATP-binding cassette domain-containing protein [Bacteroidota bacterium]
MTPTQRFFGLLSLDKKEISYIYLYAIFSALITQTLPLGIQAIISLVVGGSTSSSLYLLIGIITIGTALAGILKIMQLTVTETIQRRIFTRSAFEFAWRIPRFKTEKLLNTYPPELINRFFDTMNVQKGIPKILIDFSTAFLEVLFGLILLSFYHPFFVFFNILIVLLIIIIFRLTGPRGLDTSLKESKYKYKVAHWLEELGRAMNTFKLVGSCSMPTSRTDSLVAGWLNARKNHFRILIFQYANVVAFKTIVTCALLGLGSVLVIDNQISIGQFVAAEIIVILVLNSVEKLILTMETIYDVLTGLEKIGTVTDLPLEEDNGLSFEEIDSADSVRLSIEEVSFQFGDAIKPSINNVSFKVDAGERICLSGYNSSGKSTLARIISGLYTSFDGNINYNDIPMRNLNTESLRSHIGTYSSQEDLFHGSVIDNISLGNSVTMNDIIATSKRIGLHNYVNSLPNGYETELLAGGSNIPKNIRIKIMLARTIISQPKLLVLENFMSSTASPEMEQVIRCLLDESEAWTVICVSNDPDVAKLCDRVVMMNKGEVVIEGKFDEVKHSEYGKEIFSLYDEAELA